MLSCWHDLLFLFCLLLFYLFLPSMGWLCMVGVFVLIECSQSLPALHSRLQIIILIIIIKIIFPEDPILVASYVLQRSAKHDSVDSVQSNLLL